MSKFFAALTAALYCILLVPNCTNTVNNPFTPENAGVSLILKGSNYVESNTAITDTAGRPVRVGVCLYLTQHIDSTEIVVSRSSTQIDTTIICSKKDKMVDTAFYDLTFSSPGIRNVKATAVVGKMLRQATATITIIDRPIPNQAPKLSITGNRAIVAGETCTLLVTASDPNLGQTLTIKASGLPSTASFPDSILTWPTTHADTGTCSITFSVHDNGTPVMTDTKTVTITVTAPGVNRPPQFTSDSVSLDGLPGKTVSLGLDTLCSDPDGDSVTFSLIPETLTGVILNGSTWTFTPSASDTGHCSVFVIARDNRGGSDTLAIEISIVSIDTSGPIMRLLSFDDDSAKISSSSCQIRISCKDASGITSVDCFRDGEAFEVTNSDTTYSAIVTGLIAQQWTTVSFIAIDAAPRKNRCTLSVFIKYDPTLSDNVPPAITLLAPASDTIIATDSCGIRIKCSDASGIASVIMTPEGGAPAAAIRATPTDSIFVATVKPLTPGTFITITIKATDASSAANYSTASVRIKYDNDRTAPTLRHHTPPDDSITISENSLTVRVIAIDASGIVLTTCAMGSASFPVSRNDSIYSATVAGLLQNQWNHVSFIAIDSSLAANRCSLSVYLNYDPSMDDNTPPFIVQKGGPATGNVITDPIVTIVDSIADQNGIDSVYWTLNGVHAGVMTLVSGSAGSYRLIDTLTAFHSNRIVVHAIDASTQGNRDSAGITLDYNLPPVINDTAVSTNRNAARTWTFNARSPDNDPLTWSRLTAPSPASGTVTGTLPAVTFTPAANWAGVDSFMVRVTDGYWNDTAKITITVINVSVAPAIMTHPQNLTRNAGQSASFSVAVNGDVNPAPSYQWKKNSNDISGANAATLTLNSVAAADNGSSYTVVVSNSAGSVTSNPAVLTVNYAPVITAQPLSLPFREGQSATFSVTAEANPAPSYQWKKNGAEIPGATSASYTINNLAKSDIAVYTVTVTNTLGSLTSQPATLIFSGLLAHWSFNSASNNTFTDETGNGYDAVFSGTGVEMADGIAGQALSCSGNEFEVTVTNSRTNFNLSHFSIECWFNLTINSSQISGSAKLLDFTYIDPFFGANGFSSWIGTGGDVALSMANAEGNNWALVRSSTTITSNTWTHMVCSYDSAYIRVYFNGQITDSVARQEPIAWHDNDAHIACMKRTNDVVSERFTGKIDEMKFFNFALPADSVAAHYNAVRP